MLEGKCGLISGIISYHTGVRLWAVRSFKLHQNCTKTAPKLHQNNRSRHDWIFWLYQNGVGTYFWQVDKQGSILFPGERYGSAPCLFFVKATSQKSWCKLACRSWHLATAHHRVRSTRGRRGRRNEGAGWIGPARLKDCIKIGLLGCAGFMKMNRLTWKYVDN